MRTLYEMLKGLSLDMHNASNRPCKTCRELTEKLGWLFGCYEYQALRKSRSESTQVNKTGPTIKQAE